MLKQIVLFARRYLQKVAFVSFVPFVSFCPFSACCSQKTAEDYKEEGEKTTRSLIIELQSIKTHYELVKAKPQLQKLFNRLVETIIQAKESHLEPPELSQKNHELSQKLKNELNRIYKIRGGKELIEKYQEPSLQKLDLFEKKQK